MVKLLQGAWSETLGVLRFNNVASLRRSTCFLEEA